MKIVIAGAGEVGCHLAMMLSIESHEITVIDNDAERIEALSADTDVITVFGDPSSIKDLKRAGCGEADLFIAVKPFEPQEVNIVSAILAKNLGSKHVTARIDNDEYLSFENKSTFTEMGIDMMFYPEKIAAGEICELLQHTSFTDSAVFARGKLQMGVSRLDEGSNLIDKDLLYLRQLTSEDNTEFRVVAVSRNNRTIIPNHQKNFRFRYNDKVYVISKREGIDSIMEQIGERSIEVRKLMIIGGGAIGELVANTLKKDMEITIIDMDKERCIELSRKFGEDVNVINGDGRNPDMLSEESIGEYDAFVAVTDNSEANILSCAVAKSLGVSRTIAEVENIKYINLAENIGVDAVINKKLITAGRIFKFTLSNKVRSVKFMSGTNTEVIEYVVAEGSPITNGMVRDITNFPRDAVIGGGIRGNTSYIAVGKTEILPYDRVVVFTLPEVAKEVDRFFKEPEKKKA